MRSKIAEIPNSAIVASIRSIATLFRKFVFFAGNPRHPLLRFLVSHKGAVDYDDIHGDVSFTGDIGND